MQALIPAAALTTALGSLSAYCFTLIARVCALNKVETYGEAWEKSVGYVVDGSRANAWVFGKLGCQLGPSLESPLVD